MPTLVEQQIKMRSHTYLRHGGKQNRRQQIARLKFACNWIATTHKINRLEQIGKRQIVDFYRNHRHLKQTTLNGYYYAFITLWEWLEKPGKPPEPYAQEIARGLSSI